MQREISSLSANVSISRHTLPPFSHVFAGASHSIKIIPRTKLFST